MAQQTAVTWLLKSMHMVDKMDWDILFMRVVEMEKEQIINSYEQGEDDGYWHPENGYNKDFESAEHYYNETFNK